MIVVSFYTNDKYKAMAERMKASAERVGLNVHLYDYSSEDTSGWCNILYLKPHVILRALDEHKQDVLWVDADTRFRQHPTELFRMTGDPYIACYVEGKKYLWGGLMWVRNAEGGRQIMELWKEENLKFPKGLDDHNCYHAIRRAGLGEKVFRLPPAYQWNGKMSQYRFPGAVPVVEHELVVTLGNKPLRAQETYDRPWTGPDKVKP